MKRRICVAALLCAVAWAEHHDLVLTGIQRTVQVRPGDTINLVGDANQLHFIGDCGVIDLVGSNNNLRVQGKLSSIQIVGSGNTVYWLAGQAQPQMQSLGANNQLIPYRR
jgi:hypothetical protein